MQIEILPVEQLLYQSNVAAIVRQRCNPSDELFKDQGAVRNHVFTFPRSCIYLQYEGHAPFVTAPHDLTFYNRGQRFTRRSVEAGRGDDCEWFAIAPDVLYDAMEAFDPTVEERAGAPFNRLHTIIPPGLYMRERLLIYRLRHAAIAPAAVEEEVMSILDAVLTALYRRPAIDRIASASTRERIEYAKIILATDVDATYSLRDVASETCTSLFYLCKAFRRLTGMTMHDYRMQVRLRMGFDDLESSGEIADVALRHGFSSHSHFTSAFRNHFGLTPSQIRHAFQTVC